jgi:hypothetical protein
MMAWWDGAVAFGLHYTSVGVLDGGNGIHSF